MKKTDKAEAAAPVDPVAELDKLVAKVKAAQKVYSTFTQEQVDRIFRAAALAANAARIPLAKDAVAETGMGVVEDKIIKNHFAAEYIYNKYKDSVTCGAFLHDDAYGIHRYYEPKGIIAGIVPTTNPTSTAIFKSLLALKTRNGIIFSPHPRAKKCTRDACEIVLKAAIAAGAPENIIACIEEPTIEASNALMHHPDISVILATGGPGMVKAAYSSGKPAVGVGPGNAPALIDETADIKMAVSSILMSKTFDNGMICATEQSVVVVDAVYEEVKAEFIARGAKFLTPAEAKKVGAIILDNGRVNPKIVGQPAWKIAEMAGVKVPKETKALIGESESLSPDNPWAHEKLCTVLGFFRAKDFADGVDKAETLVENEGLGHTADLYTAPHNHDRIKTYGARLKVGRVLVNMPSSLGGIGDVYNFRLEPSLTLGCGSWGGNSVSKNVGVRELMNIKTIAERRENMLWFRVPPKTYFKYGCLDLALREAVEKREKVLLVTDEGLYKLGMAKKVTDVLEAAGKKHETFFEVKPDPDLTTIRKGVALCNAFQPDLIVALGGGSAMDAGKMMWLLYEHPEAKFEDAAMRFMDIRKRIFQFPQLGAKAGFVTIPTTSGTGSEVTPFAVVTDDSTGKKYPVADYALTPDMAIVDPQLVLNLPKRQTAWGGFDAVVHAFEAYVSVMATDFSDGMALKALELLFKYLPRAYDKGAEDIEAREKVHYGATMAGIAFANAFLGVCHSMAHKLGGRFHVPHGLANALLLPEVIRFNATDVPAKQGMFPQYRYPNAKARYAHIADFLGLGGKNDDEKIERLLKAVEELKTKIGIEPSIKALGTIAEEDFNAALDQLSEDAYDDQCTGANPRYPLISEIKQMYVNAWNGK